MSAKDIRNIVLLGHSGSGKTTLAESMLYLTGGTDRLGRIADGNTVCDYDPEEIRRQISISLAVAPVNINWMSTHVSSYKMLKAHPEWKSGCKKRY